MKERTIENIKHDINKLADNFDMTIILTVNRIDEILLNESLNLTVAELEELESRIQIALKAAEEFDDYINVLHKELFNIKYCLVSRGRIK